MKSIIINADDCGISAEVNKAIETEIINGRITSTTVIVNMADFEGAVCLYKLYSDRISFGWHINLTEGTPLIYSQELLDKGYYIEKNEQIEFNGRQFWNKALNHTILKQIKNELNAQLKKIKDYGIEITHADSHQHIHTSPSMLLFMPNYLDEIGIKRCRRLRNYVPSGYNRFLRNVWTIPYKMKRIKMPDMFGSFSEYMETPSLFKGKILELECHPGHTLHPYSDEYELLKSTNVDELGVELISYKDM